MLRGSTELIKEVEQSSILTGTSILGGLWTFMAGIFSFVFGSSLLLVLFSDFVSLEDLCSTVAENIQV